MKLCILKNKGDVMSENTIGSWIIPKDVGKTMIDSLKEKNLMSLLCQLISDAQLNDFF